VSSDNAYLAELENMTHSGWIRFVDETLYPFYDGMDGDWMPDFWDFLEHNRAIYIAFCHSTLQIRRTGITHYSTRAIIHHVRFETDLREGPDSTFKVNDHWTPYLARILGGELRELMVLEQPFFELRELKPKAMPRHITVEEINLRRIKDG